MNSFFHAVRAFGNELAAVRWEYLAIALGFFFIRIVFRAWAWRTILCAAYPDEQVRFRSVFGSYLAGVGVNSIIPARAGDAVKLYLVKHRIQGSTYATLTPTLVAETILDMFVAGSLIGWALAIGALPTHQVYSRLPSVDWGFVIKHAKWTEIGLALLVGAAVIALVAFIEHGGDARARVMRGFAIVHYPRRLLTGVVFPQAISWVFRIATVYYFLLAFQVHATIHNALLALVVDSLSTLFPATPGGAGTKQGLIVFLFSGEAISKSLLLAFSVGMNIATVVFSVLLGGFAMFMMARTISWRRLRKAGAAEQEA